MYDFRLKSASKCLVMDEWEDNPAPFERYDQILTKFTIEVADVDYETDEEKPAALMEVHLINTTEAERLGIDIIDACDEHSQDLYNAAVYLNQFERNDKEDFWNDWVDKLDDNYMYNDYMNAYIDTLYVYPEFRNKGLGELLIEQLPAFVRYYYKTSLYLAAIVSSPHVINEDGTKEPIEDEEMHKKMNKFVEKHGFTEIEKNSYVKKYEAR